MLVYQSELMKASLTNTKSVTRKAYSLDLRKEYLAVNLMSPTVVNALVSYLAPRIVYVSWSFCSMLRWKY